MTGNPELLDIPSQIELNEKRMHSFVQGTIGVCLACYRLGAVTRHHVRPLSVNSRRDDLRKPFIVLICKICHQTLHELMTNENLYLTHNNLRDVVASIRAARFGNQQSPIGNPQFPSNPATKTEIDNHV